MKSFATMKKEGSGFLRIVSYVVVAAFIISIFITGSLTSMLGKNTYSFITVEGREMLDSNVKRSIDGYLQQFKQSSPSPQIVQYVVQMSARGPVENLVFQLEAKNQGLDTSLKALSVTEYAKKQYENLKKEYGDELSYVKILEYLKDQYMVDVLLTGITSTLHVDADSLDQEYFIRNKTSEVEYVAASFQDYAKTINLTPAEINAAYETRKSNYLQNIVARVLFFKDMNEAAAKQKEVRSSKENAEKAFSRAANQVFKPGDVQEFYKLKNTPLKGISDVFKFKNGFALARIEAVNFTPFAALDAKEKQAIKDQVIGQNKKKYFDEFKAKTTQNLESGQDFTALGRRFGFTFGKTKPLSILPKESAKDQRSEKPLDNLFPQSNKPFFDAAFQKEGSVSKVMEWGENLYRVRVLKLTSPQKQMPAKDREEIDKSLEEREKNRLSTNLRAYTQKKFDVRYEWENIYRLMGIKVPTAPEQE